MSTPRTFQIELRPLEEVLAYEANSKTHPASQIEAIAASIRRFGFNDPIGVTASGVIVEGHGRLMAARLLGMEQVPVLPLPDLTDEQADLYRIAHNKIALSSTFDFALLVNELREIAQDTATFADMGFSQDAVQTLFQMFSGEDAPVTGSASSAASGEGQGVGNNSSAGLDAEVVWDDKAQKDRWNQFVQDVCSQSPERTRGEALTRFFSGVLSGEIVPGVVTETDNAGSSPADLEWMA